MNELEKMARKARKKQKGMSPFTTFGGDPEKNIDAFNHAMDTGSPPSSAPCCGASEGLTMADALEELKSLGESSLSRLNDYLQSSSVAFITAFKSTPWIKQHYAEQLKGVDSKAIPRAVGKINRARNDKLLQNIKALGYSCFKVDGSYENQERKDLYGGDESKRKFFTDKEESFAVICKNNATIDEFINRMLKLCNDYNQESFLIVYAGNKKSQFIYADGSRDDAGGFAFGSDAPFKSLVNGRPVVVENISDLIEPNIKSSVQLKRYSEPFSVSEALKVLNEINEEVGDLNHIYKESSSVVKAKRLFKEPYKMDYIKTFAIFTAYNPDAVKYSKKDNIEFQKHLKGDLSFSTDKYIEDNSAYFSVDDMENSIKNGHWHYYKVKGVYGNVERSLLVYNISLEDANELSKKYRQQSFIFGINENGVLKFEFYANASKNGYSYRKVDERDDFTVLDDDADNYYTQIARDFKINIPFEVFEVAADQMIEAINNKNYILKWSDDAIMKCIEESVDDSITGKQRYFARSTLWSNK